jgi:hypothetical protein
VLLLLLLLLCTHNGNAVEQLATPATPSKQHLLSYSHRTMQPQAHRKA